MKTELTASQKCCLSYIRFSSSGQKGNSSVDRQSPIAERVAKDKEWTYRPEWNAKNLGVSAFKGDNKKTIQAIIQARKENLIPVNTVVILEALDRATRLPLDEAYELIRNILKSGLEIYTDMNKRHLTAASLNNVTDVMLTVVELDAAFQYAHRLSERSLGGITKKVKQIDKGEKVFLGAYMPVYITGVKDGEWILDDKRVAVVKRIFREYLNGSSINQITVGLNKEVKNGKIDCAMKRKHSKKGWNRASIGVILRNPSVTGTWTFRGKEYPNYVPLVVSQTDFDVVQEKLKHNTTLRGTASINRINYLFRGLSKCKHCGGTVGAVSVYKHPSGQMYSYLGCTIARYGGCTAKNRVAVTQVENSIFEHCLSMEPKELLTADSQAVLKEADEVKAELAGVEKKIKGIVKALGDDDSMQMEEVQTLLSKCQKRRGELKAKHGQLLSKSNTASTVPESIGTFLEVIQKDLTDIQNRKKLLNVMPSVIKSIEFDLKGFTDFTITFTNGEKWGYVESIVEEEATVLNGKYHVLSRIHEPAKLK